jgi:hypothetical protein
MPDLSALLHEENVDQMEELLIPEGYWKGAILSGKLYDKDSQGDPLIDKNGDKYASAALFIRCDEPIDGVDPAQADKYFAGDGPKEAMAQYRKFIRGRSAVIKLSKTLTACGALTANRTLEQVLEELKGSDVPVRVMVEHEEYDGEIRVNVTEIAPT